MDYNHDGSDILGFNLSFLSRGCAALGQCDAKLEQF
jgi:hypothetical protein